MKKSYRYLFPCLLASLLLLSGTASPGGQALAPKAEAPVLVTSCGQSTGPATVKVGLMNLKPKIVYDIDTLATAATLQAKANAGAPYKSIIITMGASLKGMGGAGISIDDELSRAAALITEARKEGLTIIGAHVEGMKRRAQGAAAGDTTDEQSIDAVAPNANILLVYKEGNTDGRFTIISKAKGIPLVEFEKLMDIVPALEKLYTK